MSSGKYIKVRFYLSIGYYSLKIVFYHEFLHKLFFLPICKEEKHVDSSNSKNIWIKCSMVKKGRSKQQQTRHFLTIKNNLLYKVLTGFKYITYILIHDRLLCLTFESDIDPQGSFCCRSPHNNKVYSLIWLIWRFWLNVFTVKGNTFIISRF